MHAMSTMGGMPAMHMPLVVPGPVQAPDAVAVVPMRELLPMNMVHLPIRSRGPAQCVPAAGYRAGHAASGPQRAC